MLPGVSRIAYLASKEDKDWERPWGQSVRAAAQALGVTLVLAEHPPREYKDAFALISRARAEALFVSPSHAERWAGAASGVDPSHGGSQLGTGGDILTACGREEMDMETAPGLTV